MTDPAVAASRYRRLAQLGDIVQLAYVPADMDAAVAHWLKLGAGPFFIMKDFRLANLRYRGAPVELDYWGLIGHWGNMQIELIEQFNDAPSIYKDWREAGREGLHHVCIVVDDMAEARALCTEAGAVAAQECEVPGYGEVAYFDTGGGPGTIIEIFCGLPAAHAFFAKIRDAHIGWDGSRPIRPID